MKATNKTNSKKTSKIETTINVLSVAKANTKQANKETEKAAKQAKRDAAKQLKQNVRNEEKATKSFVMNDFKKFSKQWAILCDYVLSGAFDSLLINYGVSTKEGKKALLSSISTHQMFAASRYVSIKKDGEINGVLVQRKVTLRETTYKQTGLFTCVFVKKTSFSLSDLITMFQKVLRRKYESGLVVKTDKVEQTESDYIKDFETIENETIAAYKANKLNPDHISEMKAIDAK
ncbi:MAG: hypothetical protein ACRDD8_02855 [Bacteroidales bacterium]